MNMIEISTEETPNGENIGDRIPLELEEKALRLEGTAIGLAETINGKFT